jgi:putative transposase
MLSPFMKDQRRKTRQAWDEPGHAHFLTYSCYQRLPLLAKDRSRQWVIDTMQQTRSNLNAALLAYVIMPDHVHVLLLPRPPEAPMRSILASLKRGVAARAREYLAATKKTHWLERLTARYPSRTVFRFWQPGGGYDHNIWHEKTLRQVIDYIHEDPIRRGLVDSASDWRWSSSGFWEGDRNIPLDMDSIESWHRIKNHRVSTGVPLLCEQCVSDTTPDAQNTAHRAVAHATYTRKDMKMQRDKPTFNPAFVERDLRNVAPQRATHLRSRKREDHRSATDEQARTSTVGIAHNTLFRFIAPWTPIPRKRLPS